MTNPASRLLALFASVAAFAALAAPAHAEGEVNIYSSRHYDTDARLYSDFTEATGIKINLIEGKEEELMERMKAEGANSPADVFITADAGRLWRADQMGLLSPVDSEVLNERLPESLRHPDGHWFGISKRARVIFYDKEKVTEPPQTYAALADPKYKGLVCTRTGSNIYMLSLLGAYIANNGDEAAKTWAQGLKDNLAREPQGGDTDQLKGIVSGECAIAVANTYYFARGIASQVDGLSEGVDKIGIVFPDQDGNGTHVNISGAGVAAHAPNRDNAVKLLEYFTSDSAQSYFANGNNEYPVVEGIAASSVVEGLGSFTADTLNLNELGKNQARAQEIYNEIGYK
ncbi:MAG: Fe(3+) ABC transporter substrate-binding protein [Hoeflea sp.]|uniref:Fe(3+) ABC transporter substrate-binding protein n=1 Tax=Hoeflea sp. TaxID=1940281 RepID=UPI001DCAB3E3|nr:Fe(3+) ABC transporter substrate-binding protein [Hoeflea sp.]MBU4529934.1 Fe(3+) ABC transporter substrate-binding protein [Alphaproteobacteria bacterium]MBU4543161.1 Fe(3+) ABC transporter substrate-binding protein [Alphaproteobacteria bacterium]MBU4550299.1 Fe(3+) ABC transporter substrate-binding protein [Alphaproteobacteria bacterium]MBV1722427.1 Fe(3+) ABC transporter substrate-binding protein [Hoeflea sp.]MBV1761577.1 Fe(3+) ABC transporter substrate-binding protein [Hoeflea sp.]